MPTMTIKPLDRAVQVSAGITILRALLDAGIDMHHKCDGQAKCGTCHIFVQEGRKSLSKVQGVENAKLDSIVGVGSKSRLACQAVLGDDNVTIELLGFSSGM